MRSRKRLQLPYSATKEAQWDLQWIAYYKREPQQLTLQSDVKRETLPADRDSWIADEKLFVNCDRAAIEGKKVLELGSGSAFLPKLIAHHTQVYIGVDWSGLALLVAQRTCPEKTEWVNAGDLEPLRKHIGTIDTVLARHFIIHQNAERLKGSLEFEREMLRPGGRTYLDFWCDNPAIHNGEGVFGAYEKTQKVTAVYRYTETEIKEIADAAGFNIVEMTPRPDVLRNFVILEK